MKIAIVLLSVLCTALLGWALLFSSPQNPSGASEELVQDLREQMRSLEKTIQELREETQSRLNSLEEEDWALAQVRVASAPPAEIKPAELPISEISKSIAEASASLGADPQQFVASVLRDVQITQAETQRKQVLDIQVAAMKDRLKDGAAKSGIDAGQEYQMQTLLEDLMRRRSQIRGTRPWWEYSAEQWQSMREQFRELDKERNQRLPQILTPDQWKKFQQWEKKRPNWYKMGPMNNPRGDDY